jgi:cytochrome c oxidase subunit IV
VNTSDAILDFSMLAEFMIFCFIAVLLAAKMVVTIEHLLVISTLLFPPVLFIVILILILASFGTSLGLRERYVGLLISIFEVCAFS